MSFLAVGEIEQQKKLYLENQAVKELFSDHLTAKKERGSVGCFCERGF